MQATKTCPNGTTCFCSKFCHGRFPPLFPVNPVRSFCCNYDRGKAIRILDTPLMVMRKLELCDNGVKLFLKNIYYFYEVSHILEHELFCLGCLGCPGSKEKKVDLSFSEQLLRVVFSTFCWQKDIFKFFKKCFSIRTKKLHNKKPSNI